MVTATWEVGINTFFFLKGFSLLFSILKIQTHSIQIGSNPSFIIFTDLYLQLKNEHSRNIFTSLHAILEGHYLGNFSIFIQWLTFPFHTAILFSNNHLISSLINERLQTFTNYVIDYTRIYCQNLLPCSCHMPAFDTCMSYTLTINSASIICSNVHKMWVKESVS